MAGIITSAADPSALNPTTSSAGGTLTDPTTASTVTAPAVPSPSTLNTTPSTVGAITAPTIAAPTNWNVTDDQTVEGRINKIINTDSPLIQQARTLALQQANAKGLSNTSMAVQAGENAAYNVALPIATADAATASKAAGYNADQVNQVNTNQATLANQTNQANLSAQTSTGNANLAAETQRLIDVADNQSKIAAAQVQDQNQVLLNTNAQAATAFNQALVSANNIQTNPNMDASTKTQAIAQIWQSMKSQLSVIGKVADLDLTSQLNFAGQPGFDAQGNWVGFNADGTPKVAADASTTNGTTPPAGVIAGAQAASPFGAQYGGGNTY